MREGSLFQQHPNVLPLEHSSPQIVAPPCFKAGIHGSRASPLWWLSYIKTYTTRNNQKILTCGSPKWVRLPFGFLQYGLVHNKNVLFMTNHNITCICAQYITTYAYNTYSKHYIPNVVKHIHNILTQLFMERIYQSSVNISLTQVKITNFQIRAHSYTYKYIKSANHIFSYTNLLHNPLQHHIP